MRTPTWSARAASIKARRGSRLVNNLLVYRIIPFNPQKWRRYADKIETPRQTVAFSEGEFGTGSREIIAEHVSKRAGDNIRSIVSRSSNYDLARWVTIWRDDHRRTVLGHLIQ
jgi:hypothetical protein